MRLYELLQNCFVNLGKSLLNMIVPLHNMGKSVPTFALLKIYFAQTGYGFSREWLIIFCVIFKCWSFIYQAMFYRNHEASIGLKIRPHKRGRV